MRTPTTSRILAVTAILAALATGCGSGSVDLDPLRDDLEAQAQAQQSLRNRLQELEDLVATVTSSDDRGELLTGLEDLQDRLAEIDQAIVGLNTRLGAEEVAREDADAEALAGLSSLEETMQALRDQLDTLSSDLQRLREDHELLKARFENHLENHG